MVAAVNELEEREGCKFLILGAYNRSALVHKGSTEFGNRNMSARPGTPERMGFHEGINQHEGVFCCGESAYKETGEKTLWDYYWDLTTNPRPTIFILDEISQVLQNWLMGGTDVLKFNRSRIIRVLEGLIQLECVKVWAADALVGDVELSWLERLSGESPYLLRSTFARSRKIYLGTKNKPNERKLLLCLQAIARKNGRIWFWAWNR